jgi:hypothetical protein
MYEASFKRLLRLDMNRLAYDLLGGGYALSELDGTKLVTTHCEYYHKLYLHTY